LVTFRSGERNVAVAMRSITRVVFVLGIMILRFFSNALAALVRALRVVFSKSAAKARTPKATANADAEVRSIVVDVDGIPDRILHSTDDKEKRVEKARLYAAWRERFDIDSILRTPKPYFKIIKRYYPHAFHMTGKGQNACSIQIEKAGQFGHLLDAVRREAEEIGRPDDDPVHAVVEHVSFVMTFLFEHIDTRPWPCGKTIRIVDMSRLGMNDIGLEVFDFLRVMSQVSKRAFVERIHKIYIVHPPASFAFIFNTCKPLISERTLKQIVVCSTLDEFTTKVKREADLSSVPREYGGSCECADCWRDCERERRLRKLVRKLNANETY